MKIIEKIKKRAEDKINSLPVTIAFLGDSVTQGCFELYIKNDGKMATVFDKENAYHSYISKILSMYYPSVPINIINGGLSGTTAKMGYERVEKDILSFNPDLVVVCFGLNDARGGKEGIKEYADSLGGIFKKLKSAGKEVIFMTPNMMNTGISPHIKEELILDTAKELMEIQNGGLMDEYMNAAKEICKEYDVVVCDAYEKWKSLHRAGVDVTELLSNKVNHPLRQMHWLFANMLVDTILS